MDKYLAGGVVLLAGWFGLKHSLRRKKGFAGEEQRRAVERAKGMNQVIDIDTVVENKHNKNNPIYQRYTFGKLNNIPKSAEYKYVYVLPLTKSGKLRSNGKIHVAGIYPSENNEKIQELMCEQGDHRWIETDDFSKFKPMFYPVGIIEKNKKARRANYRNEIGTGNYPDLELSIFFDRLKKHDILCKRCAKATNNYHKGTFFYNKKGEIKLAEEDWQDDVEWDENYTPADKYDDFYEDVEWEEDS